MPSRLPDGDHDAFVVDLINEETGDGRTVSHLELTLVSGEHKGLVLQVATDADVGDVAEVIGMPATLTISEGQPSVRIDH